MPAHPPPPRPEPPNEPPRMQTWLSILLSIIGVSTTIFVLGFLTLGFFLPVVAISGALVLLILFHYVVWGCWINRLIQQDEEEGS